ncbi:hypothetical protein [Paenarthrobacter aurescens]|uniref:hypothetical protein n=1 Tax=Paenarthrobacter aurescens TaxID=43663 RepID=UPI0021BE236E|nr:hypothetical protein [Paenarthrobacter aurescens]MCT9868684.1 hypothetical protein [Paenarthrobacter aurescens]
MAKPAQPRSRRAASWMLVLAVFLAMGAVGCSPSLGSPPCMPPEYQVTPSSARPGEAVTVSALDAKCDPRYGKKAAVLIVVTDAAGAEVVNTTAPMSDAGAFAYTFDVPQQTASGAASVYAVPHGVDWCDDTGRNNRVGQGELPLERASCAMRTEPLTISR